MSCKQGGGPWRVVILMAELKQCDFCHSKPVRVYKDAYGRYSTSNVRYANTPGHIECSKCGIGQLHDFRRMADAERSWNRRL